MKRKLVRAAKSKSAAGVDSSSNLSGLAYRKVLAGLFEGAIPVGAFVSQKTLVDLLGVPLQPLRDALRVLEAEGIVTIQPRSGLQFLRPDMEFVHNTYQFRSLIERAAARRFAETADDDLLRSLVAEHESLLAEIEAGGLDSEHRARLASLDETFHSELTRHLNNPLLESAVRRLQNYVKLIKVERMMTKPYAIRTIREHLEILRACIDHDPDQAEQALIGHFQAALGRMMGTI